MISARNHIPQPRRTRLSWTPPTRLVHCPLTTNFFRLPHATPYLGLAPTEEDSQWKTSCSDSDTADPFGPSGPWKKAPCSCDWFLTSRLFPLSLSLLFDFLFLSLILSVVVGCLTRLGSSDLYTVCKSHGELESCQTKQRHLIREKEKRKKKKKRKRKEKKKK